MEGISEYKCPCCGGTIEFDSNSQKLKCPYCDSEFEIDEFTEKNEEKNKTNNESRNSTSSEKELEDEGINIYSCKSCGGEIVADENTAATSCPYCGNPIVMTGKVSNDLKPDYIIPFKIDKKAAKEALKKHVSGKALLPEVFKNENHIDEIKGIYVPFWLFDVEANANIEYNGKKIRMWTSGDYEYTETRHYSIVRRGKIGFNNVPVDASSKMADDLMESIEPFDFNQAVEFKKAYLAGYLADKYDVDSNKSSERAEKRIKASTEDKFRNTVNGYDTVYVENSNIHINNRKVKYVFYPVWILNTTWNKEKYVFAMNGQTGKFVGNMPTDMKKFWLYFLILTSAISVIIYIILLFTI